MNTNISLKVELPASKNGSNWEEGAKSAGCWSERTRENVVPQ